MTNRIFLTAQLRESAPYLQDAGFHESARLLLAAADEIENLHALLHEATPSLIVDRVNENEPPAEERRKVG